MQNRFFMPKRFVRATFTQMNKACVLLGFAVAVLTAACHSGNVWELQTSEHSAGQYALTLTSPALTIDTLYPSMRGPYSNHFFRLDEAATVWLTGYEVQVTDTRQQQPNNDFMCHNNMDFDVANYHRNMGLATARPWQTPRLFTLTQGQQLVQLPEGFGIPVRANDNLSVNAQVLNLNTPNAETAVQQQVIVHYTTKPLTPLYQQSIMVLPQVAASTAEVKDLPSGIASCARIPAVQQNMLERNGQTLTGHWQVPPGRDTVRTNVTDMLALPFNTTIHYIGVHVHPWCESLTLRCLSDSSVIYSANAQSAADRTALTHIDFYSSATGVAVQKNAAYELECITHNPGSEPADMMAVMLLYLHDKALDSLLTSSSATPN